MRMSDGVDLPELLKRLMAEARTNPKALALRAHLGPTAVHDILTGKSRNPTSRTLAALAEALGVDVGLLVGARSPAPAPLPPGCAENDVAPWTGLAAPASGGAGGSAGGNTAGASAGGVGLGADDNPLTPPRIAAALAPNAKRAFTYRLLRSMPAFALLSGDILVVDHGRAPRHGELVLVTFADHETGESNTVLKRLCAPWLLSGDLGGNDAPVALDSSGRAAIVGIVAASFRPTDADAARAEPAAPTPA